MMWRHFAVQLEAAKGAPPWAASIGPMNFESDNDDAEGAGPDAAESIHEPRLWRDNGWTAKVIKNEDDDGWAVQMLKDGQAEPALVGPWTMGRDKKNPKPLDTSAFNTLVKTAAEVIRRHEQQLHAMLHKSVQLDVGDQRITVTLDIVPDEFEPYAVLAAADAAGERLAEARVSAAFKLNTSSASAWVEGGYARPR
jgi:hypothetical protein